MAEIQFELPTERSPDSVRLDIERGIRARLGATQVTLRWEDRTLHLEGRGATGTIELGAGLIRVQAKLSAPLSFFPLKVEREIRAVLEPIASG